MSVTRVITSDEGGCDGAIVIGHGAYVGNCTFGSVVVGSCAYSQNGISIGHGACSSYGGIAVGSNAYSDPHGVAVGYCAYGSSGSVAIGGEAGYGGCLEGIDVVGGSNYRITIGRMNDGSECRVKFKLGPLDCSGSGCSLEVDLSALEFRKRMNGVQGQLLPTDCQEVFNSKVLEMWEALGGTTI